MAKVVFNTCYGGFSLSTAATKRFAELTGRSLQWLGDDLRRDDPALVQVVEELGAAADGRYARLQIKEVPTGTRYRIDEYDGLESVMTVDDYDWSVAP